MKHAGICVFHPTVIIITDGIPAGSQRVPGDFRVRALAAPPGEGRRKLAELAARATDAARDPSAPTHIMLMSY